MMKLNRTTLFIGGLVLGLVLGNYLTDYSKRAECMEVLTKFDEVRTIVIQNKMKSNQDSIWYNDQIETLSDLLYESREENQQLKNKLGFAKKIPQ